MCGIVGYFGPANPKDVILAGLKSLEYRGYDSAGVAILHRGEFKRVRAEGKLSALASKLESEPFDGHLGIGHTRWATHGIPSERNAHPHCVDGISIVHNGIIENFEDLKSQLLKEKAVFNSDTDSELVAHLIAREIRTTIDLLEAVRRVVPMLRGAYAVLAVSRDQPDALVAFKNGPPLIVGLGEQEVVVASDVQAILPYTRKVLHLMDDEIVSVKGQHVEVIDFQGRAVDRDFETIDWDAKRTEKHGFEHFMLKEIFEQPRSVAQALAPHVDPDQHRVDLKVEGLALPHIWREIDRIFFVACGTSFYAGLCGKYLIESLSGLPVECDIASEFRYRNPVLSKNTLVVTISQSGETADTLAALRLAKQRGLKTLSICNVKGSTIDREADGKLYMNSGVEIGVASTKALSSTIALLNAVALSAAKARDRLTVENEAKYVRELLGLPSHMETVLAYDKFFREAADKLKQFRGFLYMGRGIHYPIALEGALKLKELAYMHAEGYAAGEMKHGPLALIDSSMAVVMLAPSDDLYEKTMSNLQEAKARGAQVLAIGTGHNESLEKSCLYYLALPEASTMTMPLLELIPLQLLAYHLAASLGHDVDQPRNLAKSVTVE